MSDSNIRILFETYKDDARMLRIYVGIASDGRYVSVTENVTSQSAFTAMESMVHSLTEAEFRERVAAAKQNGALKKAVKKGYLTQEEADRLSESV